MNNANLQRGFDRALAIVQDKTVKQSSRQVPIYRRPETCNERQAIKDAAASLAALWKMSSPAR